MPVEGLDELKKLLSKLESRENYITTLNNKEISEQDPTFLPGSYLHTDAPEMSAEDSAKFEREHKFAFDQLQKIKNDLFAKLKK